MSIASLGYAPPIRKDLQTRTLDYDLLETADEQYGKGEALAAAQTVFRHLFPDSPPDLSAPFEFTQGSSRVTVKVADDACTITVPLVALPAGGAAIAALRYVLQRINGSGQLFQARLHGDQVSLEFHERMLALHPQKLLEVLRRMPSTADGHDDWMIDQFGVTPLDRGHIEPLGDAELAAAEPIWRQHWTDVEELLKEAQRKRSVWFLNELTAFAINRIRFALPLGGSISPRLNEASRTFNDSHVDPTKRETTLAKFAKDMKALSADDLKKSLGHVSYSINPFAEGTAAKIGEFFGPGHYMDTIENYRTQGHPMDAALALIGTYYYLLATCSWPPELAAEMKGALAETSDKPWRDAAALMMAHAKKLLEEWGEESDDEDGEDGEEGSDQEEE